MQANLSRIELATAILLGMSVPAIGIGKSVMAVLLIAASTLVLAFFHRDRRWHQFFAHIRSPLGIAVVVMFMFWLVSALASEEIAKSTRTWAITAFCVAMVAIFHIQITSRPRQLLVMQNSLVITALIIVAYADITVFISEAPLHLLEYFSSRDMDAATTFKPYASVAICMLPIIGWIGWRQKGMWRYIAAVAALLIILNIIRYGFPFWDRTLQTGYAALLGAVIAGLFLGFVFLCRSVPNVVRPAMVIGFISLLLVAIFAVFEHLPVPPVAAGQEQFAPLPVVDWHRQVIWGFVYSQYFNFPIIGFGPNSINTVPGANNIIPGMNQEYIPSHPHNWLLELMAETGTLGTLAILIVLILLARSLFMWVLENRAEGWAGLALMGAFWGSALGNFSIWSTWWQLTFLLLMLMPLSSLALPEGNGISSKNEGNGQRI